MTPYAQGRGWRIFRGDAMEVLTTLATAGERVQAVVTDPPYSSGGMMRGDRAGASARAKYASTGSQIADQLTGFSGDNRDQRSYLLWCSLWLGLCLDLTPEGAPIVCFSDWRQLPTTTDAIQAGGWVWRGLVPWCKPSGRPAMGRFASNVEYFAWGTNGPSPDLESIGCLPGYFVEAPPRGEAKEHLTQKPLETMRGIVRICPVGGTVLDPFMGSGSTGVGAVLEGRGFIGIERETAHLDTAARRLADAEAGMPERAAARGAQPGLPFVGGAA
jgi:site-specific DNA-methyltransferase (adenine-specific)